MAGKRSQYAAEYMMIFTFSVLMVLPLILIVFNSYTDIRYSVETHQAYSAARKIADSTLEVYYLGEGSMTTVHVTIPASTIESSLAGNEVLFRIRAKEGSYADIYQVVPVNMTGGLPSEPGTYSLRIISQGDSVSIVT